MCFTAVLQQLPCAEQLYVSKNDHDAMEDFIDLDGRRLALEADPLAERRREGQVVRPWSFEVHRLKKKLVLK